MKWLVVVGIALATGCRSGESSRGPYAPQAEQQRQTARAERLSREGADLIDTDPGRAEQLLREALTMDLFFGPAHNNLGVLYLKQESATRPPESSSGPASSCQGIPIPGSTWPSPSSRPAGWTRRWRPTPPHSSLSGLPPRDPGTGEPVASDRPVP